MYPIPGELAIGDVYFPPLLIVGVLGFLLTSLTGLTFNRYRLSRFFAYPPLVILALAVIYSVLLGTFVIPA
jgi:hypothetical protein